MFCKIFLVKLFITRAYGKKMTFVINKNCGSRLDQHPVYYDFGVHKNNYYYI